MAARRSVPVACAVVALMAAVATLLPALRPVGWNITALPRVAAGTRMAEAARARDGHFYLVPPAGYDGQFYWGIAVDPIAQGDVHQAFDKASYRYGHPLFGWLAFAASAGQAGAAPAALLVLGVASLVAGAVIASLLGAARGGSGWEGLFVAVNPGLAYSAVHSLTEPLSTALLLGTLLAYARGKLVAAAVCAGLLILSKEQFVLVPIALAGWELVSARRPRAAAVLVASSVPAVIWWIYIRTHFGAWFTSGDTALAAPLSGWRRSLLDAGVAMYGASGAASVAAEVAAAVLATLLVLLAFAGVRALRLRGPVDLIYVLVGVLVACLAPNATTLLRDALRNTSVLLVLVPFVIAGAAIRRQETETAEAVP